MRKPRAVTRSRLGLGLLSRRETNQFRFLSIGEPGYRDGKTRPCCIVRTSGFTASGKKRGERALTWWDSSGRCSRCRGGSSRRPGTRCPPSREPHHISLVDVSIDGGRASVTTHHPRVLSFSLAPSVPSLAPSLCLVAARHVPLRRYTTVRHFALR